MKRILSLVVLSLVFAGCSSEEEETPMVRKASESVKAAVRGIFQVESADYLFDLEKRPKITSIDVENMTADDVKRKFESFTNAPATHLWMPGEKSWLIVERASTNAIPLEMAMDAVADDSQCTVSFPEIFASYVGTLEEVMPAFESKLEGTAVPEWFVTKEVPEIKWLAAGDVDGDIATHVLHEIRSMQVIRRLILEGNIASREAKDKQGEAAATEKWARAFLRNPNDPILLERLDNLDKNARGFLAVGKVLPAMKCYETMILINPKDAVAVHNFGMCLKRIGREDVAKDVLKRAQELAK